MALTLAQKKKMIDEAYLKASQQIEKIVEQTDQNAFNISKAKDQAEVDEILNKIRNQF